MLKEMLLADVHLVIDKCVSTLTYCANLEIVNYYQGSNVTLRYISFLISFIFRFSLPSELSQSASRGAELQQ